MVNTRSRTTPQPRGRQIAITARDLALFRLLARYRFLPSNFIHAFIGGNPTYHKSRMTDLYHEGWLGKPKPQWEALNARYRFDTYELGGRARALLRDEDLLEHRILGTSGAFRHELMLCLVMASLELSARRFGIELLDWKDVLAAAPEEARAAESPFVIPITLRGDDKATNTILRPDGHPFGLRAVRAFWFVGLEVDRHTEPLHPTDLRSSRSSILRKILQYQQLVSERQFESRYGMPNLLVPIVTVNQQHMHNMMQLVLWITGGRGFKWMLFKTMPEFSSLERSPLPRIELLAEDWLRAGHEPLNLLRELTRTVTRNAA